MTTTWWDRRVRAILENWYGGEEQGHAIADLLWGRRQPLGPAPGHVPAQRPPDADHVRGDRCSTRRSATSATLRGGRLHRLPRLPAVRSRRRDGRSATGSPTPPSATAAAAARTGASVRRRRERQARPLTNTGCRAGTAIPQVYVGPLPTRAVDTPARGARRLGARDARPGRVGGSPSRWTRRPLSYWDVGSHGWGHAQRPRAGPRRAVLGEPGAAGRDHHRVTDRGAPARRGRRSRHAWASARRVERRALSPALAGMPRLRAAADTSSRRAWWPGTARLPGSRADADAQQPSLSIGIGAAPREPRRPRPPGSAARGVGRGSPPRRPASAGDRARRSTRRADTHAWRERRPRRAGAQRSVTQW